MKITPLVFTSFLSLTPLFFGSAAMAEEQAAPAAKTPMNSALVMEAPATKQMQSLAAKDITSVQKMREFVPHVPYSAELYDAYVKVGYAPFHAMILASWDTTEAMRTIEPRLDLPKPEVQQNIQNIFKLYHPAPKD